MAATLDYVPARHEASTYICLWFEQITWSHVYNHVYTSVVVATQHNMTQHKTTQHKMTQHKTTQHSTRRHNTRQHNTRQHKTAQHKTTTQDSTTQHNTTQDSTTQDKTAQHNTTQDSTTQDKTAQHNTTQDNTTQDKTAQHKRTSNPGPVCLSSPVSLPSLLSPVHESADVVPGQLRQHCVLRPPGEDGAGRRGAGHRCELGSTCWSCSPVGTISTSADK